MAEDPEKRRIRQRAWNAKNYARFRDKKNAARQQRRAEHPPTVEDRAKEAAWHKKNRAANPEKMKIKNAAYYAKNRDKIAVKGAAYCAKNRDKIRAQKAIYTANHPEEAKARHVAWDKANPGRKRASGVARYAANPELVNAKLLAWRLANPEKAKANACAKSERYRARKAGVAINDLSAAQIREIKQAYGFRCSYCNTKFPATQLTVDHITPVVANGNNTLHNVTVACQSCNSKKGTKLPPKPVQPLLLTIAPAKKPKEKK